MGPDISGLDLGASTFAFEVVPVPLRAARGRLGEDPEDTPWYLWKRLGQMSAI